MAPSHRLRGLQVGEARHYPIGARLSLRQKRADQRQEAAFGCVQLVAHPQFEIGRHLVIAAAARVQAARRLADDFLQAGLHVHAIDAACAGLGVALGRRPLIIKDVREGRLVAPFKLAIQTEARFRFLCLPEAKDRPQIAAFRDWYFAEIEKTAHMWDDFEIVPVKDL